MIGYYEPPFDEYERVIRRFGVHSEAYRDLKGSFVALDGAKLTYVDLLNHVYAAGPPGESSRGRPFVSGEIPNLAAVYLSAFLRRRGLRADYINLVACEQQRLRDCLDRNPVCVALTTTFYVIDQPVTDIVKMIRAYRPSIPIVVGGPLIANHFRLHAHQPSSQDDAGATDTLGYSFKRMGADIYVNESQGELTLARLVTALASGSSLAAVPNIAFFEDDELVITATEPEQNSLDENIILWDEWPTDRLGATIQTRTARSCAFHCSFCNYPSRAGRLTLASVDAVARELDSIRNVGGIRNVVFIDDTFNVPLPRFKALCRLIIERGYDFRWFSYLRCSNIDAEAVQLMARSGCEGVFLGIESGSETILKNMDKAATPHKYASGIEMLRDHGILTFASLIAGFPGETPETLEQTCEFIERNRPDYYRMQLWYCEVGTAIERQRERYGIHGQGFKWSHATMNSDEAMCHIERIFQRIAGSEWLPQWSFDFWIMPYLFGKGLTPAQFKSFMTDANRLLALDAMDASHPDTARLRQESIERMRGRATEWRITPASATFDRVESG